MNEDKDFEDVIRFAKYLSAIKLISEHEELAEDISNKVLKDKNKNAEDASLTETLAETMQYVSDNGVEVEHIINKHGFGDEFNQLNTSLSNIALRNPSDAMTYAIEKLSPRLKDAVVDGGDVELGQIALSDKFTATKVATAVGKALGRTVIPAAIAGAATYAMTSAALPVVGAVMVRKAATTLVAPHVFNAVSKVFGEDSKIESCARFGAFVNKTTTGIKNTLSEKLGVSKLVSENSVVVNKLKDFSSKHPSIVKYSLMAATTVLGLGMSTEVLAAAQDMPSMSLPVDVHGVTVDADLHDAVSPSVELSQPAVEFGEPSVVDNTFAQDLPDGVVGDKPMGFHEVVLGHLKGGLTEQLKNEFESNGIHFKSFADQEKVIEHMLGVIKSNNDIDNLDVVSVGQVVNLPDFNGLTAEDLVKFSVEHNDHVNIYDHSADLNIDKVSPPSELTEVNAVADLKATDDFENAINAFLEDPTSATNQENLATFFENGELNAVDYDAMAVTNPSLPSKFDVDEIGKLLADLNSDNELVAQVAQSRIDLVVGHATLHSDANALTGDVDSVNKVVPSPEIDQPTDAKTFAPPEDLVSINDAVDNTASIDFNDAINEFLENPRSAIAQENLASYFKDGELNSVDYDAMSATNPSLPSKYDVSEIGKLLADLNSDNELVAQVAQSRIDLVVGHATLHSGVGISPSSEVLSSPLSVEYDQDATIRFMNNLEGLKINPENEVFMQGVSEYLNHFAVDLTQHKELVEQYGRVPSVDELSTLRVAVNNSLTGDSVQHEIGIDELKKVVNSMVVDHDNPMSVPKMKI
ncbi:hypothetical protein [Photobacterium damselae]|uniref:hypothetical protein n=1 Tax=Photobacterium damselae TaxID=38293 RepID=UPI001F322878|nr:hypothetical protein [Photobacterium damselae]UKA05043.1 hypothetical protein IHC89_22615 [Photobacterium damselae subsp. damselae]